MSVARNQGYIYIISTDTDTDHIETRMGVPYASGLHTSISNAGDRL